MRSEPGVLIGPIVPAGSGGHRVDDAASDRSPTLRAGIVGFLERLQPDDAKYLFTCLPGAIGYRGPGGSLTTHCTNRNLNKFVDWINSYCAAHRRADFIPLVRRHRWKLMSTGQFRTLAWFIARQPGGCWTALSTQMHVVEWRQTRGNKPIRTTVRFKDGAAAHASGMGGMRSDTLPQLRCPPRPRRGCGG